MNVPTELPPPPISTSACSVQVQKPHAPSLPNLTTAEWIGAWVVVVITWLIVYGVRAIYSEIVKGLYRDRFLPLIGRWLSRRRKPVVKKPMVSRAAYEKLENRLNDVLAREDWLLAELMRLRGRAVDCEEHNEAKIKS